MESLTPLILAYKYWILIPLTIVEGPIVALVAGTLAAAGYFNVYVLAAVFFVREIVMDGVYYALGYYGGKTAFVRRLLANVGVRDDHLEGVRALWQKHPFKTMFVGKISYGIASSFIALAGMIGMDLRLFYGYGAIVAVLQYGVLLALGYLYGNAFGGNLVTIFENIQYGFALIALIGVGYYFLSQRAKRAIPTD